MMYPVLERSKSQREGNGQHPVALGLVGRNQELSEALYTATGSAFRNTGPLCVDNNTK